MSSPHDDDGDDHALRREELSIYAIIVAASMPVLIGLAIEGGDFDGGATLSMVLVVFGIVGLIAGVIAAVRTFVKPGLPVATLLTSRRDRGANKRHGRCIRR